MRLVTMCLPFFSPSAMATPLSAMLLDSVLPQVKTSSSGAAPSSFARAPRAPSSASRASMPIE